MHSTMSRASLIAGLFLLPSLAFAAQGNIATNFGLLPADVATAQGLSYFSNDPSAVFYNPAHLAKDPRGTLSAGFLYVDQNLRADPSGYPDQVVTNPVIQKQFNNNVLLGFKTDLGALLKDYHPIVLGFMLGAERAGNELLALNSSTSQTAQSLRYGKQTLFLSLGAGTELMRGIQVGASSRVTLQANANLIATSNLAGQTSDQTLQVSAKPSIQPIVSANIDWGQLICPDDKYCLLKGLETAITYRGESSVGANVNAAVVIPGTVAPPGLLIALHTFDSFQPETYGAAIQYNLYKLRIGASAEYQRWSGLNSSYAEDTIKGVGETQFRDIVVPRIGLEYRLDKEISLLAGVSYEQSPLKTTRNQDTNYVDNDRIIVGAGASYLIKRPILLASPLRLDVGYQYHILIDRNFLLSNSQTPSTEVVRANGTVNVIMASATVKF